ncbi:hypothetical protein [Planctomyces sp. SH-PL14]|uniref:hypothetical protein n=1 Tax=Planctomyces sp. SH-PL14 TaxID=1632864 RepID=UPI00078DCEFD|nr:hypothetical protein [Planctomyces sp. SH-PL14]AMV20430.1 hypothetical protein VT03_21205 [Planctomyces sp. SH-PL14]
MDWLIENWQTVAGGLSGLLVAIVGASEAGKRVKLKWLPLLNRKAAPVASAEDEIDTAAAELLRVAKIARTQGRDAVLNHTVAALTELMRPVREESK